jgi:HK97 family phage major capsid protein
VYLDELLETLSADLRRLAETDELKNTRTGSRFVGADADPEYAKHVARGGSFSREGEFLPPGWKAAPKHPAKLGRSSGNGLGSSMVKALAEGSGSSGGYIVPFDVAVDIVMMLRARSAIVQLGPTVVPVKKELDVTSLSSGASASYIAENSAIPVSEETFAQAVLLRPKELAALVPVSNRLLRDAADNPSVEQVIRQDLAEVLARSGKTSHSSREAAARNRLVSRMPSA